MANVFKIDDAVAYQHHRLFIMFVLSSANYISQLEYLQRFLQDFLKCHITIWVLVNLRAKIHKKPHIKG